ncbi:MAG TPA: guanylate kinase [Gemmatimonadaceae bacterium]|nr:guanylate kinase [Gemmatimonadaceae bacterium]
MNPFAMVLSAPSGSGKTTVTRELRKRRNDVGYSVSCTTRERREDERDGVDYFFLSKAEFARRQDRGAFAEWAEVHGQLYGTLKAEVQRVLDNGQHVLMDIDVQGAAQLVVSYPSCVTVFVLPPSVEVLVGRLRARHTENPATLLTRLKSAHAELAEVGRYHYVVVNDDLDAAVRRVSSIIDAEEVRRERVRALGTQVAGLISRLEREIEEYATKA